MFNLSGLGHDAHCVFASADQDLHATVSLADYMAWQHTQWEAQHHAATQKEAVFDASKSTEENYAQSDQVWIMSGRHGKSVRTVSFLLPCIRTLTLTSTLHPHPHPTRAPSPSPLFPWPTSLSFSLSFPLPLSLSLSGMALGKGETFSIAHMECTVI